MQPAVRDGLDLRGIDVPRSKQLEDGSAQPLWNEYVLVAIARLKNCQLNCAALGLAELFQMPAKTFPGRQGCGRLQSDDENDATPPVLVAFLQVGDKR